VPAIPSPVVLAPALLGGYALGRSTGNRKLAGAALAAGLAVVVPRWSAASPVLAAALTVGTVGLVGVSHPLAKRTGPWPAVLTTTAAAAVLAAAGDRFAASR
jgi:hypothetical protein